MKFFISCHKNQMSLCEEVIKELDNLNHHGVTLNLQKNLNQNIFNSKKLDQVTGGFDYVIIIFSKTYLSNAWLKREFDAFFAYEQNLDEGSKIIPIIVDDCAVPQQLQNNNRKIWFLEGELLNIFIKNIIEFIEQKKHAFVVMKMNVKDLELEEAYRKGIIEALKETGYTKRRIDDYNDGEKISPRILKEIKKSDLIIADLTGERPNCYYEVGYAHALNKNVILCAKDGTVVHFDLKDHNIQFWSSAADLKNKLIEAIRYNLKNG